MEIRYTTRPFVANNNNKNKLNFIESFDRVVLFCMQFWLCGS